MSVVRSAKVWVILPAYNEEDALLPLLKSFRSLRQDLPWLEVVVVNDGSQDNTVEVVTSFRDHSDDNEWVHLVIHDENKGLGQAMRTGFATVLAMAKDEELIVTMDADNTHRPSQIPEMIGCISTGADVVIASRFVRGASMVGIPSYRRLFSWGVSILFRLVSPIENVRDYSCGFRLYRAQSLRDARSLWEEGFITEQGFACMTEIIYRINALARVRFSEVPIELRYDRKPGSTKMPLWQNIKDMLRLMWRQRRAFARST
ncbi:MAG: glycosyltransferase family 2 protein [Anaerolineales bacterium]|jgi:dolichol-phosphate mannosyltransferase|nr:glycosyltransferase family 2 protein [Anaerolineales bacterium]HJN42517.1 glycosyltransferase family 2 protein [Anaerolineales bacterium]|tara:strand:+ start:8699 stop:9478 length:780 start_codon:yes stop_codon:yes gene_type:complete